MSTTTELPYDVARASEAVQTRYCELLGTGVAPRMAEILALRMAPRGMTDSIYFCGQGNLDKQFGDAPCGQLEMLVKAARGHGYEPGMNDVYDSGLARFFGDPLAFVPATGGRNHIRRVAEARDIECHGPVEVKRQRMGETAQEQCRLGADLVEEGVEEMIAKNPELRFTADRRELREEVILKHGFDNSKLTGEGSKDLYGPSADSF